MRFSRTFLTVDIVLFVKEKCSLNVLLIKRKNNPFQDCWALPGGFVDENEDLEVAALRELQEETTIKLTSLQQLKAFGKPYRDPRSHVVSIAFTGFVPLDTVTNAADDAKDAKWFPILELPKLAFDHDEIINFAVSKI